MKIAMLIFSVICFAILAAAALIGFARGAKKSLTSLIRIAASIVISFAAVAILCRVIPATKLFSIVISDSSGEIFESEAVREIAGNIAYSLAAPIVFALLFVIVDLLMRIPANIISKPVGAQDGQNIGGRFIGAAAKLAAALAVMLVLVLPFSNIFLSLSDGIVGITDTAKEYKVEIDTKLPGISFLGYTLTDAEGKLDCVEVDRLADDIIGPVRSNIILKTSYSKPIRLACNFMTNTSDQSSEGRNELAQAFDVLSSAVKFAAPFSDYGDPQKDAVNLIYDYVSASELHGNAVADAASFYAKSALAEGKLPGIGTNTEIITSPLFDILAKTTAETIVEDFGTLRNIIIIMIDYKLPPEIAMALESKSLEELVAAFADEGFLYELMNSLYGNDDFRHMIAPVLDYAFTAIMQKFDPDAGRMNVAHVPETYTDEFLRREAGVFNVVLSEGCDIMKLAPMLTGGSNAYDVMLGTDLTSLGRFVDKARESEMIGDGVTMLFVFILKSSSFDKLRSVADILVKHIESGSEVSVENLLAAAQNFLQIAQMCKEEDGEADTAAMADAMRDINAVCDPETTAILKEMITESDLMQNVLASTDGNDSSSDAASKALGVMVEELAVGEFTDEEYEREARAVEFLLKLLRAKTQEEINELCRDKAYVREMVEIAVRSRLASSAMIEIAYEDGDPTKPLTEDALKLKDKLSAEDIEKLRTECRKYYIEAVIAGEDLAQVNINLKAFSAILNAGVTDELLASWKAEAEAMPKSE